ncbi:MAG TPA: hypothetical protein VFN42_04095, partial [Acetobacteraceae bacterium]|nr:hypothetical protein [Acetobacteraceae bacterium]
RWLRQTCGVDSVTLVGARIGAAIAARAACAIDGIEALIMVSPVASGRRFLRELVLAAHTNAEIWQVEPRIDDGMWFEAHGLRLDRVTRNALQRLDVANLPSCPAPNVLVLDSPDSASARSLVRRLGSTGAQVTQVSDPVLAAMLRDSHENEVPHEAFAQAVAWHAALNPSDAQCHGGVTLPAAQSAVLALDTSTERPLWFGPDHALLGVLCEPTRAAPDAPVVLIANTGANPRYGNSRAAVTVARWLATLGVPSLRIDGTGIGDSLPQTGERGLPYSLQGDADLQAGIDALTARFSGPVIVLGMCSGAYHALRGAFQDTRIRGLMLLNLQKFVWRDGESLSVVQRTTLRTTRFYMRNAISGATLRRLLRGDINVAGISKGLAGRAGRRVAAACDPAIRMLQRKETPVGRVRRQVRELAARSVQILFILSGNDPGLDEIAEYFGAQGRMFRRLPNVTYQTLEGADHTLSANWARQALMQRIAVYLNRYFDVPIPMERAEVAAPRAVCRQPDPSLESDCFVQPGVFAQSVAIATGASHAG